MSSIDSPYHVVPDDIEVAVAIYRYYLKGESVWFSKLVKDLEGRMSRDTISKNIDQLFDLGIINSNWIKDDDGKWVRTFSIAVSEREFIRSIDEMRVKE